MGVVDAIGVDNKIAVAVDEVVGMVCDAQAVSITSQMTLIHFILAPWKIE